LGLSSPRGWAQLPGKERNMALEVIKNQIDRLFGDTSRPASDTRADLKDIRDHCDSLIETIDETSDEED
jgi:Mg2+ and Co2+ transporter CorA